MIMNHHYPIDKDLSKLIGNTHQCDTCLKEFPKDDTPNGSYQTYNGEWFCSDKCGRKAGW